VTPADDAGGLAVSMKLGSSIARNKSIVANIQNAMSFGEVQDGALSSSAKIVDRMAELKALSLDVMKSTTDVENYNTEFKALQNQLLDLTTEKFNGVSLFNSTTSKTFGTDVDNLTVITSDQGGSGAVVSMSKGLLLGALTFASDSSTLAGQIGGGSVKSLANASGSELDIATLSLAFFAKGTENIATLRATSAAGLARLQLAEDHVRLTVANLEAANSRIMDVDVAAESTRFAKYNILSQVSASMLVQANQTPATALMLL
ncbi:flagellin, partial [Opitutales bacterium]|nr:flagellin [Opitutales bacterium]